MDRVMERVTKRRADRVTIKSGKMEIVLTNPEVESWIERTPDNRWFVKATITAERPPMDLTPTPDGTYLYEFSPSLSKPEPALPPTTDATSPD